MRSSITDPTPDVHKDHSFLGTFDLVNIAFFAAFLVFLILVGWCGVRVCRRRADVTDRKKRS